MYDKVEQYVNEKLLVEQEMFSSDEYIRWLINYLEANQRVCAFDDNQPVNEIDRENINKLFIFYKHIKKYAEENYIIFEEGINGQIEFIYIRLDDKLLRLDYIKKYNGQVICELVQLERAECINYRYILANIPISNKKSIVDYKIAQYNMTNDPQKKEVLKSEIENYIREIRNEQVYEFGNSRGKRGNN